MIRFSHPHFLLLLPLVCAYTWWVLRGSLADLRGLRSRAAITLRLLLIILLVFALSGPQWIRPTTALCTVFVVDISDSIPPRQRDTVLDYIHRAVEKMQVHKGDSAAVVAFGAEALLDHAPEDKTRIGNIVSLPGTTRTDIAAGIQLAMASFPQEAGKQIVLFTDGNENLGSALDQAGLAQSNDIRINVVPLVRESQTGEALLVRVDAPTQVKQGAPFQVTVLAEATRDVEATITLYRNRKPVDARQVALKAGKTAVAFEQTTPDSGMYRYSAVLDVAGGQDTIPDNNIAFAYTRAQGQPTVLVVQGRDGDGAALAETLRRHRLAVELGGPDRIPADLAECARYDSIVFANVPAWRMSPAQLAIIRAAVRDTGMGFAMIGGEESFGAGGYYDTPVEDALPVTMDVKKDKVLPSLTLVIVIDTSGSMAMEEGGVQKIRLAAEAAKAAVKVLQPFDQLCVLGYDTPDAFRVTVPMQPARNKGHIYHEIDKLAAGGGGIMTYSSLREAYKQIRGSRSQVRHIIICADAQDTEEQEGCIELMRKIAREKITLSVIGFGRPTDPHVAFQKNFARAGLGHAYLAERLSNLPQIFARDVMETSRSLLVEKPFRPNVQDTVHAATRGIPWEGAPPLLGYVATSPQASPLTRVLLSSPEHDPVLATWSYGLGRSLAFTSDATAHWGAHWLGWEAYGSFWSQALRWTLRQSADAGVQVSTMEEHGRATVSVDAVTAEGEYRNLLDLRAHVALVDPLNPEESQHSESITLEQTAPGHYQAGFDARTTGVYVVTVEERKDGKTVGTQLSTLVVSYSPEYQTTQANLALLSQVAERTDGKETPPAEELFRSLRFGSRQLRDLWPLLLPLLAILFLADVAVRRVLLPWDELLAVVREMIAARLPQWRRAVADGPAHAPTLGTLLTTKEQVRQTRAVDPPAPRRQPRQAEEASQPIPAPFLRQDDPPAPAASPSSPSPAPAEEPSAGTVGALLKMKRGRQTKE